jgi:uncharacterized protein (TIGR02145 family)
LTLEEIWCNFEYEISIRQLYVNERHMRKTFNTRFVILIIVLQFLFTSCILKDVPTVRTSSITEIEALQAKSGGDIKRDGNSTITEAGVCWSIQKRPSIYDSIFVVDLSGGQILGDFYAEVTELQPNTKYFVKAFATNDEGTGYGNEVSFTTSEMEIASINFNPAVTYGNITDLDGNVYKTINIGTQVWMAENLKTTKYCDGSLIPNITNTNQWKNLRTGAYCDYVNYSKFSDVYGHLYNWYSVNTGKLCPTGWHVPSDSEWDLLIDYLGGEGIAAVKLTEYGKIHWDSFGTAATNESGFTALPGGIRNMLSSFGGYAGYTFEELNWLCYLWTSTPDLEIPGFYPTSKVCILYGDYGVMLNTTNRDSGCSVRCLRD